MIRRALAGSIWAVSALAALALLALAAGAAGAPARPLEDIKWLPTTLPKATVGVSYGATLEGRDEKGGALRRWDSESCPGAPRGSIHDQEQFCQKQLPTGMTLEYDTPSSNYDVVRIKGVPQQAGAGTFTLTFNWITYSALVGSAPPTQLSHTWTLVVDPAKPKGGLTVSPAPDKLPSGEVGKDYRQRFTVEGGVPPYTFGVRGLPPGMKLTADGILSGTPKLPGDYRFTLVVRDSEKSKKKVLYVLSVRPTTGADLEVEVKGPDVLFVKEAAESTERNRLLTRQVHFKFVVLVTNHGPEATVAKLTIELEHPPLPGRLRALPIPHEVTGDCEKALSYLSARSTINCSYPMSKGETRRAQVELTFPTGAEKPLYKSSQYTAADLLSDLFDGKGFKIDATVEGSAKPDDPDNRPNRAVHQVRLRAR